MERFTIGEEVLYHGERFVIAGTREVAPYRYRLLATTPAGAKVVWATESQLEPMETYTRPNNDTDTY